MRIKTLGRNAAFILLVASLGQNSCKNSKIEPVNVGSTTDECGEEEVDAQDLLLAREGGAPEIAAADLAAEVGYRTESHPILRNPQIVPYFVDNESLINIDSVLLVTMCSESNKSDCEPPMVAFPDFAMPLVRRFANQRVFITSQVCAPLDHLLEGARSVAEQPADEWVRSKGFMCAKMGNPTSMMHPDYNEKLAGCFKKEYELDKQIVDAFHLSFTTDPRFEKLKKFTSASLARNYIRNGGLEEMAQGLPQALSLMAEAQADCEEEESTGKSSSGSSSTGKSSTSGSSSGSSTSRSSTGSSGASTGSSTTTGSSGGTTATTASSGATTAGSSGTATTSGSSGATTGSTGQDSGTTGGGEKKGGGGGLSFWQGGAITIGVAVGLWMIGAGAQKLLERAASAKEFADIKNYAEAMEARAKIDEMADDVPPAKVKADAEAAFKAKYEKSLPELQKNLQASKHLNEAEKKRFNAFTFEADGTIKANPAAGVKKITVEGTGRASIKLDADALSELKTGGMGAGIASMLQNKKVAGLAGLFAGVAAVVISNRQGLTDNSGADPVGDLIAEFAVLQEEQKICAQP